SRQRRHRRHPRAVRDGLVLRQRLLRGELGASHQRRAARAAARRPEEGPLVRRDPRARRWRARCDRRALPVIAALALLAAAASAAPLAVPAATPASSAAEARRLLLSCEKRFLHLHSIQGTIRRVATRGAEKQETETDFAYREDDHAR